MGILEKQYRFKELVEKMHEFILNESIFADDHPSWSEVADAEFIAMGKWNETDEGKEMTALIEEGLNEDELEDEND
jgi:hypothetical protein